jgi:hypothetical protein
VSVDQKARKDDGDIVDVILSGGCAVSNNSLTWAAPHDPGGIFLLADTDRQSPLGDSLRLHKILQGSTRETFFLTGYLSDAVIGEGHEWFDVPSCA